MKKIFIVLVLIMVVAFLYTITCIIDEKTENLKNEYAKLEIPNIITKENVDVDKKDSSYTVKHLGIETYKENDLTFTRKFFRDGKPYIEKYTQKEVYPVEINYLEISGLKDSRIQDRINKEIKDECFKLKEKFDSNINEILGRPIDFSNETDRFINGCVCKANFSNILSIHITSEVQINDSRMSGYNYYHLYKTLNYDLTTGNHIELDDYFTSFDDARKYIVSGISDCVVFSLDDTAIAYVDEGISEKIENYIIKEIRAFDNNQYDFYITPESLCMILPMNYFTEEYHNEYLCSISMNSFSFNIPIEESFQDVTIYKKFITDESIFNQNSSKYGQIGFYKEYSYNELEKDSFIVKKNNLPQEIYPILDAKISSMIDYFGKDNYLAFGLLEGFEYGVINDIRPTYFITTIIPKDYDISTLKDIILNIYAVHDSNMSLRGNDANNAFYDLFELQRNYPKIKTLVGMFNTQYTIWNEDYTDLIEATQKFDLYGEKTTYISDSYLNTEERYYGENTYSYKDMFEEKLNLENIKNRFFKSKESIQGMINFIYAKNGKIFDDTKLQDIYMAQLWYIPKRDKDVSYDDLTAIGKNNVDLLEKLLNTSDS